jgi:hypothetical protein
MSHFKFGLYLNNQPITERIFDKNYIPNINLKDVAKNYIKQFVSVLSAPDNSLNIDKALLSYKKAVANNNITYKNKKGELVSDNILERKSVGSVNEEGFYENKDENFKFILFNQGAINEKGEVYDAVVIERNFIVKNYNPNSRFSYNLNDTLNNIVTDIQAILKDRDSELMYKTAARHPYSSTLIIEVNE